MLDECWITVGPFGQSLKGMFDTNYDGETEEDSEMNTGSIL